MSHPEIAYQIIQDDKLNILVLMTLNFETYLVEREYSYLKSDEAFNILSISLKFVEYSRNELLTLHVVNKRIQSRNLLHQRSLHQCLAIPNS